MSEQTKRPLFDKWWFWVIVSFSMGIVILLTAALTGNLEFVDENDNDLEVSQVEDDDGLEDEEEPVSEDVSSEPDEEPELEEKTDFGINEKIEFENRIIEVTDVEYSEGDRYSVPAEGKEYVIVTILIENNSDEEISYNPRRFRMQNSQGQIEMETFTIIDKDTSLSSGDLASGGSVSGTLVWEQPINDDGLQLIFEPSFWSSKRVTININ